MMEDYKSFIKELFDSYKCTEKYDILKCIPVYEDNDKLVAYLRPITANYRETIPDCAQLMGDWRAQNPSISASTFDITVERTEKWLDNLIIGRPDRLLFMITLLDGTYVGHIGFSSFNYDTEMAEIDSVMRGVRDKVPGMMTFALRTMLWWGKNVAKIKHIELSTDLDNMKSQELYRRCGFIDKKRKALVKVVKEDEVRWDVAENQDIENAERYTLQMILKE
jgi:RimJ/RimL family protein N-acetyltransferase